MPYREGGAFGADFLWQRDEALTEALNSESVPAPKILTPGESISIVVAGRTVRIAADQDVDGGEFLRLAGQDCDLEGEQPGLYYPRPLGTI